MNWIDEGNKFYEEYEFEKSLECYKKALESDPSNLEALYNKVFIHIMQGDYQESLDTSDRLIKTDQTDPEAWKLKGFALFNLKKYKEAVDAFNEAIKLNPDDAYTWNNKGAAFCNLDCLKEAIESFDKAFSLDSRYVNALKNKEKVLSLIKQSGTTKISQDLSDEQNLLSETRGTRDFRSFFQLAGVSTDLGPGPEAMCPVDSCHYRAKLRIKGQRCPEHGVKLVIAASS